ncbi:hypothetical protein GCM10023191_059710 [Actinoallomurus oryzae]|jgi:hypothetical protein|uniref:Uncharacterized protein n=1 Tax=Actinoallomurus oryzae TaxID=502180 RepID=A0ABP8QQ11_9ACTN
MNGHALAEVVGAAGLSTVIAVTIWQIAAIWRAKVLSPREGRYHQLAETTAAVQERTDLQLREITLVLEDMRARLASLERILKEVE